jgi:hypothetical protein
MSNALCDTFKPQLKSDGSLISSKHKDMSPIFKSVITKLILALIIVQYNKTEANFAL